MGLFWAILLILIGFVCLIKGADFLVEGASAVAKKFNVSDIVIGLTIVSMGTSAPELVINVGSVLEGKTGFVYGNVVGSNLFNTFLILGIAGMVYPLKVLKNTGFIEVPISLFAVLVVLFLSNDAMFWGSEGIPMNDSVDPPQLYDGVFSRLDGVFLLLLFVGFFVYVFRNAKSEPEDVEIIKPMPIIKALFFISLGIAGLIFGGNWVLSGSTEIAKSFGLSDRIIGLTVLAAGTSLPELATSVVAASKKNSDIAIGNVVGSNIFNILGILAISAVVKDVGYISSVNYDMLILALGHVLLFTMFYVGTKIQNGIFTLDRWQAFILAAIYVGYTTYLVLQELHS